MNITIMSCGSSISDAFIFFCKRSFAIDARVLDELSVSYAHNSESQTYLMPITSNPKHISEMFHASSVIDS